MTQISVNSSAMNSVFQQTLNISELKQHKSPMEEVHRWRSWCNGHSCSSLQEIQIIPSTPWLVFSKHNAHAAERGRMECVYYPTSHICRTILYLWPRNKLKRHCHVGYSNGPLFFVLPAMWEFSVPRGLNKLKLLFVYFLPFIHSTEMKPVRSICLPTAYQLVQAVCTWASWEETEKLWIFFL